MVAKLLWCSRSSGQAPVDALSDSERAGPHRCCAEQPLSHRGHQRRDSGHSHAGGTVRSLHFQVLLEASRSLERGHFSTAKSPLIPGLACVGLNLLTSLKQVWQRDGGLRDAEFLEFCAKCCLCRGESPARPGGGGGSASRRVHPDSRSVSSSAARAAESALLRSPLSSALDAARGDGGSGDGPEGPACARRSRVTPLAWLGTPQSRRDRPVRGIWLGVGTGGGCCR